MANIKFEIDVESVVAQIDQFKVAAENDIREAVSELAKSAHSFIVEEAANDLKDSSLLKIYMSNLEPSNGKPLKETSPGVWNITLKSGAMFIEEGIKEGYDMKSKMLQDAKTSASGFKYKIIPFDHGAAPTTQTKSEQGLTMELKSKMNALNVKRQQAGMAKIPWKAIEKNGDGSPRVGKIHSLNLGGDAPGKGNTPAFDRVSIYQTKTPSGSVRRDILTFRTMTNNPNQKNKWIHPGLEAKKFMDKAYDMITETWEKDVLPKILEKWK